MSLFPPNAPIVFFWDRLEGISFCGEEAVADGLVGGSGCAEGVRLHVHVSELWAQKIGRELPCQLVV
jgi:hypothetical protein